MSNLIQSAFAFCRGILSRSYFWAFALVLDPFDLYNRFKPPEWPKYDIGLEAFFYFLAGLVFWTSFLTYHDLRKRTLNHKQRPNIPLHEVCRYVAKDSVWASSYPKSRDNDWVSEVYKEVLGRWHMGDFEIFGCRDDFDAPVNFLVPAMKEHAEFDASKLVTTEPPTHIWNHRFGDERGHTVVYYRVHLDKSFVEKTWPKRSLISRVLRKSPIERIGGYEEIFRDQTNYYLKQGGFTPTPLAAIIG